MKTILLSLLLVVVCTFGVAAQDRAAPMPEWHGAMLTGSQRLMLFSLLKTQPGGSLPTQKLFARRLGFFHRPGDGLVAGTPQIWATPILAYDHNVNGGVPGKTIPIDGGLFVLDPDTRAKAALVMGAGVGANVSLPYAHGSTLDFQASGVLRHAPSVDVTRSFLRLSACANQYLTHWNWFVLCAGYKYDDARDIDMAEDGHFGSVGLRRVFSSAIGSHEAGVTVSKDRLTDYDKLMVSASFTSGVTGLGAVGLSVGWGERVPGFDTVTRSAAIRFARPVFGKDTRLSLGYTETGGSNVFGTEREDRIYTLTLSRQVTEWMSVGIGTRRQNSTADVFDDNEVMFDVSFTGWTF